MKKKYQHKTIHQTQHADCETFDVSPVDEYKDFRMEPTRHYVLIRVNLETQKIEVAVCNKGHEILKVFKGEKPRDLYSAILKYERDFNLNWFEEKTHIAYLGKELKKAELALNSGSDVYTQE